MLRELLPIYEVFSLGSGRSWAFLAESVETGRWGNPARKPE
jgi:hypothetical protein